MQTLNLSLPSLEAAVERNFLQVSPQAPLSDVLTRLCRTPSIGYMVIVDRDQTLGCLSERELLCQVTTSTSLSVPIAEAIEPDSTLISLAEIHDPLQAIAQLDEQEREALPAVDARGHLVGVLSYRSLCRHFASALANLRVPQDFPLTTKSNGLTGTTSLSEDREIPGLSVDESVNGALDSLVQQICSRFDSQPNQLQAVVEQLQQGLQASHCWLIEPDLDEGPEIADGCPRLLSELGCYYRDALRQGQPIIISHSEAFPISLQVAAQASGTQAVLIVPLVVEQSYFGAIALSQDQPRQWSALNLAVVQAVAQRCAIALQADRLEAQAQTLNIAQSPCTEAEPRTALVTERDQGELRSRFIGIAAHEFRTPLTTILSSAELLEHYRYRWSEEKQQVHLKRIQNAALHLSEMLDDILTICRAEAGKLEFNPMPMNLPRFCQNLVEDLQPTTKAGQAIALIYQGDYTQVSLDERLLRHILTNLLSNAIKYSPRGSKIQFSITCQTHQVCFQIQDHGIGIPPEDRPHLFESFCRAANASDIPGSGLGLTIVKSCTELHGGQIQLRSELGKGTTFTVTIPIRKK